MDKDLGVLASSTDPSKVAATVQGIIVAASAGIILVLGHFGVHVVPADVQYAAGEVGLIVGTGFTLFGLIRKFVIWVHGLFA